MKRFTLKATAAFLAAVSVFAVSACGKTYTVKSEDDVMDFLADCGISTAGECSRKTVTIPDEFGEVYERYNDLQKQQGFDLSGYRSREAEVYTVSVVSVNGEHTDFTEAHVMVCDDRVIGGDLSSPYLDGGMSPIL